MVIYISLSVYCHFLYQSIHRWIFGFVSNAGLQLEPLLHDGDGNEKGIFRGLGSCFNQYGACRASVRVCAQMASTHVKSELGACLYLSVLGKQGRCACGLAVQSVKPKAPRVTHRLGLKKTKLQWSLMQEDTQRHFWLLVTLPLDVTTLIYTTHNPTPIENVNEF